jgi:hypothetical protein
VAFAKLWKLCLAVGVPSCALAAFTMLADTDIGASSRENEDVLDVHTLQLADGAPMLLVVEAADRAIGRDTLSLQFLHVASRTGDLEVYVTALESRTAIAWHAATLSLEESSVPLELSIPRGSTAASVVVELRTRPGAPVFYRSPEIEIGAATRVVVLIGDGIDQDERAGSVSGSARSCAAESLAGSEPVCRSIMRRTTGGVGPLCSARSLCGTTASCCVIRLLCRT